MRIYLTLLLLLPLNSCDFSDHKWVLFKDQPGDGEGTVLGWDAEEDIDDDVSIYTFDSIQFDNVQLYFYSDKSYVNSYLRPYYLDTTGNEVNDSVRFDDYAFPVKEKDDKIIDNDSILAIFKWKKKTVHKTVLKKKHYTSTFTDRLPLIRMH